MDLLASILNSMDMPPGGNQREKEIKRKHDEQVEKMKNREKEELNRFRKYAEERIDRISKDDTRKFIQFQPLDKVYRSVIHDVAEVAGLLAMSFGQEGVDRYTILYKKECTPSEDEIQARRNGEEWNENLAKEYAERRIQQKLTDMENAKKPKAVVPHSNYKDKYVHLIGQDAALQAAKKTESNLRYGFVPSENKKDIRTIEQTIDEMRAKKMKFNQNLITTSNFEVDQNIESLD